MIGTKRSLIYFIRSMENDVQTTLTLTKPDDYRKQYCFTFLPFTASKSWR
ncbi:hypothetical protein EMIT0180MI3_11697 [Priestia megaterium]